MHLSKLIELYTIVSKLYSVQFLKYQPEFWENPEYCEIPDCDNLTILQMYNISSLKGLEDNNCRVVETGYSLP